eukprot:3334518-Alexandrium_andersonii.AAC.1
MPRASEAVCYPIVVPCGPPELGWAVVGISCFSDERLRHIRSSDTLCAAASTVSAASSGFQRFRAVSS